MDLSSSVINFFINGKPHSIAFGTYEPTTTLLIYLKKIGLTGTKLGCGEGGCGACTVMISKYQQTTEKICHFSANACLFPLYALDNVAVTTVEGIGGMKEGLHPIQKRIASLHGSQCGYCTPGIIMAIYSQLRANPSSTPNEIEESLDGNLCRCTGYRPILDGAKSLSNNKGAYFIDEGEGGKKNVTGGGCCGGNGKGGGCPCKEGGGGEERILNDKDSSHIHCSTEQVISSLPSLSEVSSSMGYTEPIFPPALMKSSKKTLSYSSDSFSWFQPVTLNELLLLKGKYPTAKLVCGNTEIGIETKFKGFDYKVYINPSNVTELNILSFRPPSDSADTSRKEVSNNTISSVSSAASSASHGGGLLVGASVTLNSLRSHLLGLISSYKTTKQAYLVRGYEAIVSMLNWFASNHIRNVATLGGNIVTASPISDMNPLLLACAAVFQVISAEGGIREVPASEFFLSYRRVNLKENEVLLSIFIPTMKHENDYLIPWKQARRREDDISIVTAGMRISLMKAPLQGESQPSSRGSGSHSAVSPENVMEWIIEDIILGFGGMSIKAIIPIQTCNLLKGKKWNNETFSTAYLTLKEELKLPENVPGGQSEYRTTLALSFLFKTICTISNEIGYTLGVEGEGGRGVNDDNSGRRNFLLEEKGNSRGEQIYYSHKNSLPNIHANLNNSLATAGKLLLLFLSLSELLSHSFPSSLSFHCFSFALLCLVTDAGGASDAKAASINNEEMIVGKAIPHKSSESQVCGNAVYTNDIPLSKDACYAALVMSTRAHALIKSVDVSEAEKCPGFIKYLDHHDIKGSNKLGPVIHDEELFVEKEVKFFGSVSSLDMWCCLLFISRSLSRSLSLLLSLLL
jgi:xanthine dehydrogenase/oxidase